MMFNEPSSRYYKEAEKIGNSGKDLFERWRHSIILPTATAGPPLSDLSSAGGPPSRRSSAMPVTQQLRHLPNPGALGTPPPSTPGAGAAPAGTSPPPPTSCAASA